VSFVLKTAALGQYLSYVVFELNKDKINNPATRYFALKPKYQQLKIQPLNFPANSALEHQAFFWYCAPLPAPLSLLHDF
jgi:hypothetical protein